jgi:hypothetical protein
LKEYGLDVPRIQVDFKAPGDKDSRRLLIGDKSPTGADLFATATARSGSSSSALPGADVQSVDVRSPDKTLSSSIATRWTASR